MSNGYITFEQSSYALAVDSDRVERLTSGKKLKGVESLDGLTLSVYDISGQQVRVAELCEPAGVGERCPVICLRPVGSEDFLYLRASSVGDLYQVDSVFSLPEFDATIARVFTKALHIGAAIYYLVDVDVLFAACPGANSGNANQENIEESREFFLQIPLRSQHWLAFTLRVVESNKRTGSLILGDSSSEARISFTGGHPVYADYKEAEGLAALRAMSKVQNWNGYQWSDKISDEAHNITASADAVIDQLKESA